MEEGMSIEHLLVLIIPLVLLVISTAYLLYQFINFYSVLGLFCSDNCITEQICNNFISISILVTLNFQLSVGSVTSILLEERLMPFNSTVVMVISIAAIVYLIVWNITIVNSVMRESKLRLGICWFCMLIKTAFLAYLIIRVSSMRVELNDVIIFALLTLSVIVILLDAIILCRTIMALNMFGKGFSTKAVAARKAAKVRNVQQEEMRENRPLSSIVLA
ncbi:uncharacterized protein [Watersipora subatra]|uniref:uncharacterized protein n=1 Tax=Watersipora subatra TaxID=2589382 RepID=UPI00355C158B